MRIQLSQSAAMISGASTRELGAKNIYSYIEVVFVSSNHCLVHSENM